MTAAVNLCLAAEVALLAEGVDRNMQIINFEAKIDKSPSSRRAWIEIQIHVLCLLTAFVALLAEGVDRNNVNQGTNLMADVALLAEGVDRNSP